MATYQLDIVYLPIWCVPLRLEVPYVHAQAIIEADQWKNSYRYGKCLCKMSALCFNAVRIHTIAASMT